MMRTMSRVVTLLAVLSLAAPALAGDEKKLDVPKFEMPKLDLPSLDTPSLGDVEVEKAKTKGPATAPKSPSKVTFELQAVTIARGFKMAGKSGCVPKEKIEVFRLPALPGTTEPFQTCLRMSATEGVIASIAASITGPDHRVVAEASGEVSFARKSNDVDFVIDWGGFPVRHPGDYELKIVLGGETEKVFPVKVEGPKE